MKSGLFIGRFQPFHRGHLEIIKKILKENDKIIIVIGSAEKKLIESNPLTAGERFQLIDESLKEAKISAEKYSIIPVRDIDDYSAWVSHINSYVPPYDKLYTGSKIVKDCYEGKYSKGREKNKVTNEIVQIKRRFSLSATKVREAILKNKKWEEMVPPATAKLLKKWNIQTRLQKLLLTKPL